MPVHRPVQAPFPSVLGDARVGQGGADRVDLVGCGVDAEGYAADIALWKGAAILTATEPPRSTWGGEYALIRDATRPWDLRPCHHLGCHREDRRMATLVSASRVQRASGHARLARRGADALGGRYSTEPGIDAGARDAEIERWFLAATLFGTRISSAVAERTFGVLSDAGLARIGQARHIPLDDFIAFLDEGGSARYAAPTAARLKALSRYHRRALRRAGRHDRPAAQHLPDTAGSAGCAARLGAGNYPAVPTRTAGRVARPRSRRPARAPGTPQTPRPRPGPATAAFVRLARLAARRYTGRRDLESGLVRLALADHRGGWACARAGTGASCSAGALSVID